MIINRKEGSNLNQRTAHENASHLNREENLQIICIWYGMDEKQ